jgi:hypothetical protein
MTISLPLMLGRVIGGSSTGNRRWPFARRLGLRIARRGPVTAHQDVRRAADHLEKTSLIHLLT